MDFIGWFEFVNKIHIGIVNDLDGIIVIESFCEFCIAIMGWIPVHGKQNSLVSTVEFPWYFLVIIH